MKTKPKPENSVCNSQGRTVDVTDYDFHLDLRQKEDAFSYTGKNINLVATSPHHVEKYHLELRNLPK